MKILTRWAVLLPICFFNISFAGTGVTDCVDNANGHLGKIGHFFKETGKMVAKHLVSSDGPTCNRGQLPLSKEEQNVVDLKLSEVRKKLGKSRKLTKNEEFMLSRGIILALRDPKFCTARPSEKRCEEKALQEPPKWGSAEFWPVVGPKGCEGVNQFETRIAIDFKTGQVQLGTRLKGNDYSRIGVDLCRCEYAAIGNLGYSKHSAIERHQEGWMYLVEAEKQSKEDGHNTSVEVNRVHDSGRLVVATLGFARGWTEKGSTYRKKVQYSIDTLNSFFSRPSQPSISAVGAILTGGYRGAEDDVYGITRAGHDIAKGKYRSLVITPDAGVGDTHQYPASRSVVGRFWGDDSKALAAAADLALVFYRGQTHKETESQMGRWTEIEVAHLKAQGVPYVLINIDEEEGMIAEKVRSQLSEHKAALVENLQLRDGGSALDLPRRQFSDVTFDYNRNKWVKRLIKPGLQMNLESSKPPVATSDTAPVKPRINAK